MNKPHALYRFFDASGALLYVGITLDPGKRWKQHRDDKPWWTEVATAIVETFPTREAVAKAERAAIISEHPRYNIVHNRGTGAPVPISVAVEVYDSGVNQWTFRNRRSGYTQTTDLHLSWEVNGTAMSDDWLPEEIDAHQLLRRWLKRYGKPEVSIYWSVAPVHETAPFQGHQPWDDDRNFLTYFTWPEHAHTGEPVNFNRLPVLDGAWNAQESTKGGFFQQATGWKPAPLQGYVNLPDVLNAANLAHLAALLAVTA